MTITAEEYISRVLEAMPRTMPLRTQIAMELRGHITERVDSGLAVNEVLRQLGDPVKLAESYLSAEPLVSASFGARVAAKLLDVLTIIVALSPVPLLAYGLFPAEAVFPMAVLVFLVGGSFAFGLYTIIAEYVVGHTLGKRLMGIRVVTEIGARITFGQAIVRQLPMFLQVYMVDVMFALFTEHSQRAFELLSKTRTVRAIDPVRAE
jgi:uncharacterized RDD family membrane protein YckC